MTVQSFTRMDAVRRTAIQSALATISVAIVVFPVTLLLFGTGEAPTITANFAIISLMTCAIVGTAVGASAFGYIASLTMRDLTLTRNELYRLSRTDQLTGLLNRRGFDEAAASILSKAYEDRSSTAILMCDIDRFKAINDSFGHEFGDQVLVQISDVLRSFARDNGMLIGRHGGEEFAAIVRVADSEQATEYAEALRKACIKDIANTGKTRSAHVTVSVGCTLSRNSEDFPRIMRAADKALYIAKNCGRNRVALADIEAGSLAA